ncbi:MAG: c-type cytochrome domain-containing protein [Planctomycetaceae bacterium]
MRRSIVSTFLVLCVATPLCAAEKKAADKKPSAKKPAAKITYDEHVKPIFRAKCFSCHNGNKKKSGLDLTNYTNLMLGGSSGEVIERGAAGDSYLYSLINHESQPFMPPKSEKLAKASLETIRKWIDGGALENAGSKPVIARKKFDLALKSAPTGKPAGPPPMPGRLSRQPVLRTPRTTAVTALATSAWAPLIAVAGQKQVFLYESKTLKLLGVLPFPEGVARVLKFSRNGSLLLAGGGKDSANGRVVVWNVKTGRRVIELGDELDSVLAADISADHRFIALGGPQRIVRIYSTETGKLLHEIRKHTEWVYCIEFSPDGVLLASADRNGGMFVWETHTAREYLNLKGHGGPITGLSWRSDSNILASCGEDRSIRLWEMQNGRQVKSWTAHGGGTAAVEFTRDGRLVSCGRDRSTKLWDQNGKALRTFPAFADLALRVTHCDETNRVIAGDWTGTVRVWNAANGKPAGELATNPPVSSP